MGFNFEENIVSFCVGGIKLYFVLVFRVITLKCLSIGTPKAINFPFASNEKLFFLGVPVFKNIVMRL